MTSVWAANQRMRDAAVRVMLRGAPPPTTPARLMQREYVEAAYRHYHAILDARETPEELQDVEADE